MMSLWTFMALPPSLFGYVWICPNSNRSIVPWVLAATEPSHRQQGERKVDWITYLLKLKLQNNFHNKNVIFAKYKMINCLLLLFLVGLLYFRTCFIKKWSRLQNKEKSLRNLLETFYGSLALLCFYFFLRRFN